MIVTLIIKEGDTVEIRRLGTLRSTPFKLLKVTLALPEDQKKNIVRIGEGDFQLENFKLDEKCYVASRNNITVKAR